MHDKSLFRANFIPKRSERSGTNLLVPFPSECRDRGGKLSLALVEIPPQSTAVTPWGGTEARSASGSKHSLWECRLPWGIDTFHYRSYFIILNYLQAQSISLAGQQLVKIMYLRENMGNRGVRRRSHRSHKRRSRRSRRFHRRRPRRYLPLLRNLDL
jgi:hypothetical protein